MVGSFIVNKSTITISLILDLSIGKYFYSKYILSTSN